MKQKMRNPKYPHIYHPTGGWRENDCQPSASCKPIYNWAGTKRCCTWHPKNPYRATLQIAICPCNGNLLNILGFELHLAWEVVFSRSLEEKRGQISCQNLDPILQSQIGHLSSIAFTSPWCAIAWSSTWKGRRKKVAPLMMSWSCFQK